MVSSILKGPYRVVHFRTDSGRETERLGIWWVDDPWLPLWLKGIVSPKQ